MSTINYSAKEIRCKVVYYGPGLGGKTTNVQAIYKMLQPHERGELVSLSAKGFSTGTEDEARKTRLFDFMPLRVGVMQGFKVIMHMYTVPGEAYHIDTRRFILRGVDGVVFVVDSQGDRLEANIVSKENLYENLSYYRIDKKFFPLVLQYNKRDLKNISPIPELNKVLNTEHHPFYTSIAVEGIGVLETLQRITEMVLVKIYNDLEGETGGNIK
ncbi:MAG: gliding-motility protein MglA [Candidatus Coatesbacteria bacterium]|nr:gliding-motility protein MglA [Candidatus Coatesbacteria bacterium]